MIKPTSITKKFVSIMSTLIVSAAALVGLSTDANAATISPVSVSNGSENEITGNQRTEYFWFKHTATANQNLTVETCTGDNLGSNDGHTVTLYKHATDGNVTNDANLTAENWAAGYPKNCGIGSKGKQATIVMTSGVTYYVRVNVAGNGFFRFKVKFSVGAAPTDPVAFTYVRLDRVTICHRTHATTNPYRMITVSTSSIVGSLAAGSPIRGHGKHATDARRYDPPLYGTFDPNKNYAPNAKLWGDIIPPFEDNSTGGIFEGLNWSWGNITSSDTVLDKTEFGTATTSGTNATAQAAVDLCKGASGTLTSKQLFELERKNGQKRTDILDEIKDTDQYEPEVYKEKDALEKEIPSKEGPKEVPTTGIDQSLAGKVWLDVNRNGFQEDTEPYMANIQVTVQQGNSPNALGRFTGFGTGAKFFENEFGANLLTQFLDNSINKLSPVINSVRSLFGMATTYTVYTDKNGSYLFVSLPAGEWNVTGLVPAGLEVTYDSFAGSDANVDATVPVGGFAFTWIGLVGPNSTGINAPILNPDGTPVTGQFVLTSSGNDAVFCNADDVNYLLTAVDGKLVLSGIPNGSYYIRQIGTTSTIADFNVVLNETYTGTIKTVKGVRCSLLTANQLAATGSNLGGLPGITLLLLLSGAGAVFAAVKLERKFKN